MSDLDLAVIEFMNESPLTAVYIQKMVGEYDPATGEAAETVVEVPVRAILMDLTLQSNGLSTKYGTLVEAGDKELYIQPPNKNNPQSAPLAVQAGSDRVRVGSIEYKVITFKELNPTGEDPILFSLYIRR